jgi:hypothetical protein
MRSDRPPQGQKKAGCGEGVPAVFFLVDGGALSQLGDEVCRWRGEHVKPVVGDGAVRPAVRPSELDGFQVVVSVEVGDD